MEISLRTEDRNDWQVVEILTRKAFWREERISKIGIGCDEHYLVHTLRNSNDYIPELNIVAEVDGEIVGHVIYSHAYIETQNGIRFNVLNFGPISVAPEIQRKGIGSALMKYSLKKAAHLGFGSVFFYGHPTYYPRFGFKEAKYYDITTWNGDNYPAFMGMELIYGDLEGIKGKFIESPLYNVNPELACEYDKNFVISNK